MTSIDDVIQPGQPIPDDVTAVRDPTLDTWCQQDDGLWDAFVGDTDEPFGGSYEDCSAAALRALYPTLTVTAVREQPAEPEENFDGDPAIGAHIARQTAQLKAMLTEPEPQQADASPVLDLVQQLRMRVLNWAGNEIGVVEADEAAGQLDRIAALVPQQPVQARNSSGVLLWIHGCGRFGHAPEAPAPDWCPGCRGRTPGRWLPLLVGGDPAPERVVDHWYRCDEPEPHPQHGSSGKLGRVRCIGGDPAPEPDELRVLLLPVWQEFATSPDEPDNDALIRWVRLLVANADRDRRALKALDVSWTQVTRERDEARAEVERLQAAAAPPYGPDPLVLSLPEVPEGTDALVASNGWRWLPTDGGWWNGAGGATWRLVDLLATHGPLTVELAPPREPRTWPKVDAAPVLDDQPETLEVNGWRWHLVDQSGGRYYQPGQAGERTIQQLRELGDVTEVTE